MQRYYYIRLPDGKIIQQSKNIFTCVDKNIEYDGKYTKMQTEMVEETITFTGSTTQPYSILPTGKYYQCHSCVMQISLTGQLQQTSAITLTVGYVNISIIKNKSVSTLTNTYHIIPLLSDRFSHIILSAGESTYIDAQLPVRVDLRSANTPFKLKCNEALSIKAEIVLWYV